MAGHAVHPQGFRTGLLVRPQPVPRGSHLAGVARVWLHSMPEMRLRIDVWRAVRGRAVRKLWRAAVSRFLATVVRDRVMKRRMPKAKDLVGKKIVRFLTNPFPDGRGGTAHNPRIVLNDGSVLSFTVEETDVERYGVFIVR